jgi:DNA helicase HerA-like ATPase
MILAEHAPPSQDSPAETAGFTSQDELHGQGPKRGPQRPLALSWITDDLLHHTQQVWSRAYGRTVTENEAIEMLLNVKRLAEVILTVYSKGGTKQ